MKAEIKIRKYPAKLPTRIFKNKKLYNRKNPRKGDFFVDNKKK